MMTLPRDDMTPLEQILIERITTQGPLTIADYMTECLLHPQFGYYTTRDPFGAAGDFITAPEISQIFGEMLGLCLAQAWLDQGAPAPFALAELGPGRGTLMADILRVTARVPEFHAAAHVHLVEASPRMRAAQARALAPLWPADRITWHDQADDLPRQPLFLVANEFFDALPIRQFRREDQGFTELVLGVMTHALCIGQVPAPALPALAARLADTRPGDIVEICAAAPVIAGQIGQRIADHGGAALIIDYGDWRSLGDTLQAMGRQQFASPVARPGEVDLTAHVDFEALLADLPCAHSRLTPQGVFLERLGITARAQALAAGLADDALAQHVAAHRRLTHPQEMGTLFKVVGLFPQTAAPPPGLDI
jgi:NADH dehydrogenase [ubiquinone] 1 alpha subcomplex assembly factor 7